MLQSSAKQSCKILYVTHKGSFDYSFLCFIQEVVESLRVAREIPVEGVDFWFSRAFNE